MEKGSKMTIEHKRKLSIAHIGKSAWNKGLKGFRQGHIVDEKTRKKISSSLLGHGFSNETLEKMRLSQISKEKMPDAEDKLRKRARIMARKIPLKSNCEICQSTENLGKHHWRYDKPLLVNTLCKECHDIQHVKNFQESKFGGKLL